MGSQISHESQFPKPGSSSGVEDVILELTQQGFDFVDDEDDENYLDMTMPVDWSIVIISLSKTRIWGTHCRYTDVYYIVDSSLQPWYLVQLCYREGKITKVNDFVEEYPVTIPLPSFYQKKSSTYALNDEEELVKFYKDCVAFLDDKEEKPYDTKYSCYGEHLTPRNFQHLLNQERQLQQSLRESFRERAQELGLQNYAEFSSVLKRLHFDAESVPRILYEKLRCIYKSVAALPEEDRQDSEELKFFYYSSDYLKCYVVPTVESFDVPMGSLSFEETCRFYHPFLVGDFRKKIEAQELFEERVIADECKAL